jgi:GTP cyclohydrolase IIa
LIQLSIIRVEGYGPWTLTLGSDREAVIQMLQAQVYYEVQRLFSDRGALAFFNRFDEYFAVTNGVGASDHAAILQELARLFPKLEMSMTVGTGSTPLEASLRAYEARKTAKLLDGTLNLFGSVLPSQGNPADHVQIMHIDVDSSTKVGARLSPYEVTALVMRTYSRFSEDFLKLKALTFFLGGDNFMIISNGVSAAEAESIISKSSSEVGVKFNCGIGIGQTGRKAAEAATKALDTIRDLRDQGKITPIYEIRCP